MTTRSLTELAALVKAEIHGDTSAQITGANPLATAQAGDITLLDDPSRFSELAGHEASAVVVTELVQTDIAQLVVPDVHEAFSRLVAEFRPPLEQRVEAGIHPSALVDSTADIAEGVSIGPGCNIGANVAIGTGTQLVSGVTVMPGTRIGCNVTLFPGVVLYENTILEDGVWIHAGSILGAYGFGYRQVEGRHERTGQLGYVHVEKDVEIGASVTVDRGTYGATRIGEGTKIDNQVMIAHNCRIGRHNLICSQVGIAGSCTTGDYVILAGQVGLKDHIHLSDGVIVGAQAGVMNDCPSGGVYLGSPATTQKEQMQIFAMWRRLPEIRRGLKKLEQAVDRLQQQGESNKAA